MLGRWEDGARGEVASEKSSGGPVPGGKEPKVLARKLFVES